MAKPDPDREWQHALAEHAAQVVKAALSGRYDADNAPILPAPDQGGPVVEIQGPDGEWRRYFVRLTEVRT